MPGAVAIYLVMIYFLMIRLFTETDGRRSQSMVSSGLFIITLHAALRVSTDVLSLEIGQTRWMVSLDVTCTALGYSIP